MTLRSKFGRLGWAALAVAGALESRPLAAQEPMPPLRPEALAAAVSRADLAARGEFLVRQGACNDCHTPLKMGPNGPEPDMSRFLSGHPQDVIQPPPPKVVDEAWPISFSATGTAAAGPWGVSFTRNLTPDVETGLGGWTEDEFVATIKSGRKQGRGRALLPPMPWPNYSSLTDDDLKAMFAYLKTIPPIRNKVPDPLPPPAPPPAAAAAPKS